MYYQSFFFLNTGRKSGSRKSGTVQQTTAFQAELTAESTKTTLDSPNYPGFYLQPYKIEWNIKANTSFTNAVIKLSFLDVHFPTTFTCYEDHIDVMDGPSMLYSTVKTFCGDSIPNIVTLSGDSATVFFYSNSFDNEYRGFQMEYWAEESVDLYGPVEYTSINYILIVCSVVIISIGIIAFLYLVVRDCRKKPPIHYNPNPPFTKPPLKKRYSEIYEKHFIAFNSVKFKKPDGMKKIKLPTITDTLFTSKDEVGRMPLPNRT